MLLAESPTEYLWSIQPTMALLLTPKSELATTVQTTSTTTHTDTSASAAPTDAPLALGTQLILTSTSSLSTELHLALPLTKNPILASLTAITTNIITSKVELAKLAPTTAGLATEESTVSLSQLLLLATLSTHSTIFVIPLADKISTTTLITRNASIVEMVVLSATTTTLFTPSPRLLMASV